MGAPHVTSLPSANGYWLLFALASDTSHANTQKPFKYDLNTAIEGTLHELSVDDAPDLPNL